MFAFWKLCQAPWCFTEWIKNTDWSEYFLCRKGTVWKGNAVLCGVNKQKKTILIFELQGNKHISFYKNAVFSQLKTRKCEIYSRSTKLLWTSAKRSDNRSDSMSLVQPSLNLCLQVLSMRPASVPVEHPLHTPTLADSLGLLWMYNLVSCNLLCTQHYIIPFLFSFSLVSGWAPAGIC